MQMGKRADISLPPSSTPSIDRAFSTSSFFFPPRIDQLCARAQYAPRSGRKENLADGILIRSGFLRLHVGVFNYERGNCLDVLRFSVLFFQHSHLQLQKS